MQEFVKICLMDKTLGDSVLKIFRAVISALWQIKFLVKTNWLSLFTFRHLELYIRALVLGNVFCPDQAPQGEILGQTQWNLVSNSFISLAKSGSHSKHFAYNKQTEDIFFIQEDDA